MPNPFDDIKQSIGDMALTSPGGAIVSATAKVGQMAQDAYDKVKEYLPGQSHPIADRRLHDIALPSEHKHRSKR